VLVDDGKIVVIGGLIQNTVRDGEQKVPLLGDIPVLGGMFRYRTRVHSKTNLMIFLRPTLVRDNQRADAYTGERYDYIIGEQIRQSPCTTLFCGHGITYLATTPGTGTRTAANGQNEAVAEAKPIAPTPKLNSLAKAERNG